MTDFTWLIAVPLAGLIFFAPVILRKSHRLRIAAFVGYLCVILPAFTFVPELGQAIPLGLRLVGVALLFGIAHRTADDSAAQSRSATSLSVSLFVLYACFGFATTFVHGRSRDFVLFIGGAIVLSCFTFSIERSHAKEQLRQALTVLIRVTTWTSLALGVLAPSAALEGDRLRGVFENANTLGFIAFICGVFALLSNRQGVVKAIDFLIPVGVIVWTGSRASMAALLLFLLLYILFATTLSKRIAAVFIVVFAFVILQIMPEILEPFNFILRDTDSRASSLSTAMNDWNRERIWGVGLDSESDVIASTPLRALSNGGIVGSIIVVLLWLLLFKQAARRHPTVIIFVFAAVIHSFVEGWFLSPVSPLLLIFVASFMLLCRDSEGCINESLLSADTNKSLGG